ncbi:DUF2628 domain-containing protein [Bacillus sp. NTK071]|uniref:c-type cytochrome n=1 Tax=Bacillus sp. NTK071 TaxID=2802175 RepID=UPI001A8C913D|nr:DUF2628 domain-containing protein [Bacillus sp. NTK071]MBN8209871.1 DUF2628 domain-containing protein [Bacillus sp. NTK071]
MFCANCGQQLQDGSQFCSSCGNRIEHPTLSNKQEINNSPLETDFSNQETIEDEELLLYFVGEEKQDYYLEKWKKGKKSWNWAAFFGGLFWLGYRKMYSTILIIAALFILIDVIVALSGIDGWRIDAALSWGIAFSLGVSGNYTYKKFALKRIKQLKARNATINNLIDDIRTKGGRSWRSLLISVGMMVAYGIISVLILTYIPPLTLPGQEQTNANTKLDISSPSNGVEMNKVDISKLIDHNIQALQDEDIDSYMSTIYKDSSSEDDYNQTLELLSTMFDEFDLNQEVTGMTFLSINENEAKVRLTQTTTLLEGADFRDNKSILIHTLKKQNGQWKFLKSEVESIEYLDATNESDNVSETITSDVFTLSPQSIWDFSLNKEIDLNGDGTMDTITFKGGPMRDDEYLNEQVEIKIEINDQETGISVDAESNASLFIYDIDQDGWVEFLYETGGRLPAVDIYQFGEEGLEYVDSINGKFEDAQPFEVTTSEEIYSYEEPSPSDIYEEASYILQQSCISCHGSNLEGAVGPRLLNIGGKYSQEEIQEIIVNGKGSGMPGGLISEEDASKLAEWLITLK